MHKISIFFTLCFLIFSCKEEKSAKNTILSESSGNLNHVSVVVNNQMWNTQVGEAIRNVLAQPIYGLPQDEPMFTMSQIPPQVFSGFATKNRTVLKIEKSDNSKIKIARNVFAKPQTVVLISGPNNTEIIKTLNEHASQIISAFKTEELKEKQRRINLSLHQNNSIQKNLGIQINFPSAYRIAKVKNNVYWIRKDVTTGTTNLLLYTLPFSAIKKSEALNNEIVKIRDSINKIYIPGPTDEAYVVTENDYAPFLLETIIDNKPTIETKGIWDMENAFMSGPYVNFLITDKANNRYVVAEGFTFSPSVEKRDYMFELEAIIRSIKIL